MMASHVSEMAVCNINGDECQWKGTKVALPVVATRGQRRSKNGAASSPMIRRWVCRGAHNPLR
jgi:hypothetical protein